VSWELHLSTLKDLRLQEDLVLEEKDKVKYTHTQTDIDLKAVGRISEARGYHLDNLFSCGRRLIFSSKRLFKGRG